MSSKSYSDLQERLRISDNTWEEEIKRLKHDIKKTENRIIMTEKRRKLFDKSPCDLDLDLSDVVSMDSDNRNVNAERVTAVRQRLPGGTNAFRVIDKPSTPPKHEHGTWVSPSNVLRKRSKEDLPRSFREPEVPTSPKRIRSSPHRVVDNPRPEDTRGDWVPMKEVRQTAHQISFRGCEESVPPRSSSQCTYTVRRSVFPPEETLMVRKVSVLEDLEPTEVRPKKPDQARSASDRIKRTVHANGRVVKVSALDDFAGISKMEERRPEPEEKTEVGKRNVLKKMVLSDVESPRKAKTLKKSVEERDCVHKNEKKEEDQNNKENKPRNGKSKDEKNKTNAEVDEVMTAVKNILNDRKDEACAKRKTSAEKKKPWREEDVVKKAKTEERKAERKRNVDLKAVQRYIKMQKMKRMEQSKMEREKKAVDEEARKKKLEELRIRTLQLAATSKKKAQEPAQVLSSIKVVETEAEVEEDITASLGLKQTKPKVSYNESILNLRKKPVASAKSGQKQEETPIISEDMQEEPKEDAGRLTPLSVSAKLENPKADAETNANLTLKKLAETLQLTMEQQKRTSSTPSLSPRKTTGDAEVSAPAASDNRNVVTVDVETIKSLKQDIKKISENFQVLHEIITDKTLATQPPFNPEPIESGRVSHLSLTNKPTAQFNELFPSWSRNAAPRPYPYNVLTAVRSKIKLSQPLCEETSERSLSSGSASKSESESETVPVSTNRFSSCQIKVISSTDGKTGKSSTEDNYYSLREDSISELSSSILDSDRDRILSKRESLTKPQDCLKVYDAVRNTPHSSALEEIISMSLDSASSVSRRTSSRESLVLIPPDVQLNVQTRSSEKSDVRTFSRHTKPESTSSAMTDRQLDEFESKSDVIITELDELVTESEKTMSAKVESAVEKVSLAGSTFNPEALHLQFQAELSLLETFQRSLAQFLEVERVKALSQTSVKADKAVNTEYAPEEESVKSAIEEGESTEPNKSVETQLDAPKAHEEVTESIKTGANDQKSTESTSLESALELTTASSFRKKSSEKNDLSDNAMGISFQMLNRMMKDEELRSEHQLALIRMREKTLNEKVKAELTLLEIRKKAMKERGSSEELAISAIKKKQRGILLKYQNEREDIERLKKMHKIASEERKIMIKQQKQIRKMQLTTKDMLIKLKKREKSPQKSRLLVKGSKYHDNHSEIHGKISINMFENTLTETITSVEESIDHSIDSDLDITSRSNVSEGDDEILRRNTKTLEEKISKSMDKLAVSKKQLVSGERKHLKRGPSVDDLLKWTKRLEEKENWLKEMEKEAENLFTGTKHKSMKFYKDAKTVRDRSTSPFQFQEVVKSICESSPSITEAIEAKKSSLADLIESKTQGVENSRINSSDSVPEKLPNSTSEDIPEEFSKKVSGRLEYSSESFESRSSSDTRKTVPVRSNDLEHNVSGNGITIKMALSPRVHSARRRYSSGSDDSINLFHTETASEQSDVEIRIAALHEQLRRRKLEAERLRREQRKAHRERLKAKEQSLLKQIEAYDTYIQKKKQELEREYEKSPHTVGRPVMKQSKGKHSGTVNEDEGSTPLQNKFALRNLMESDSEVAESIKEEDSEKKVGADSTIVSEIMSKNKDSPYSTTSSMLESLPKQAVASDESDEQTVSNASVKTTLLSPERAEVEESAKNEIVKSEDIETVPSGSVAEENYSQDSFESEETAREEEEISEERKSTITEGEVTAECIEEEENVKDTVEETPDVEDEASLTKDEVETAEVASDTPEEFEDRSRIVSLITESVLNDLMNESVEVFKRKSARTTEGADELEDNVRAEDVEHGLELLTSMLAADLVSEAIDDSIRLYNRRKMGQEEKILDVRRRVHEIMSQAPGTRREQRRPQDMMVTTYDVTAAQEEEASSSPGREEFLQSLSAKQSRPLKVEVKNLEATPQAGVVESCGQEWFEDDFGLSRTRREAEELRVQQLQIEQEIQQLQAQQEQVLYYYLRQIPNKPPPPYTPPGSTTAERFTSEAEITAVMSTVVRFLTDEINAGKDVGDLQPPGLFFGANDSEHVKCYKVFLFDLAKHIISEAIGAEFQENRLPWMRTNEKLSRLKIKKTERTYECLLDVVMKQVLVLFGFQQKMGKERLIVRWSRKKRDHVDELLVGESQEEEAEWTQYDEDEVTVKNNVTMGILDSLLDETAQLFGAIWTKKVKI